MSGAYISVKELYERYGEQLEFAEIRNESDDGRNYYDLMVDDHVVCMDGETCKIVNRREPDAYDRDGYVELLNEDGEQKAYFRLTCREFEIATFANVK